MKLSGVMLGSDNPTQLANFYTKILGEPGWHQDDWYGYNATGNLMIGPHSEVKGSNDTPGRIMFMFEVDDVKLEFERIKAAGGKVVAEPYQPNKDDKNNLLATFADPDNNYFQLATPWKS